MKYVSLAREYGVPRVKDGRGVVMTDVVAIGLDLAWSTRNLSGGAVIVDGVLREARADLANDAEIVQWIGGWLGEGESVVVAVDAPLCVPNEEGKRACETLLGNAWRKYDAGPYPSNRRRFADIGIRGEVLVRLLNHVYQFVEAAPIDPTLPGRYLCEVFPHPAHVSLFKRQSILKYKKKGKRSYAECWSGLEEYAELLQLLAQRDPPLLDPSGLLPHTFEGSRGKVLKALEDTLDAVTCAYVASYLWQHGPAGTWTYGSVAEGHILVPRYPPAGATR